MGQVEYPWFMCESYDGGIMVSESVCIQEFFLDGRPPRVVVQFNDDTTFPPKINRWYILWLLSIKHFVHGLDVGGKAVGVVPF